MKISLNKGIFRNLAGVALAGVAAAGMLTSCTLAGIPEESSGASALTESEVEKEASGVGGTAPEYEVDTSGGSQSSEEIPDFALLMASSAAERITDTALLTALWEDYLHFTYMNLSNGYEGFDSVEDLDVVLLARYLYIQMDRAGDTEGIDTGLKYEGNDDGSWAFGIPREKLEEYCERYFGRTIDFTTAKSDKDPLAFVYRQKTDTCHFYPETTLEHFVQNHVDYNQGDIWPYFQLNFVDRFADDAYLADCSYDAVSALNGEKLTKKFVLKRRDDGSFYLLSCHLVWPETHYIQAEGSFEQLPVHDSLSYPMPILAAGTEPDTVLMADAWGPAVNRYALVNLKTGQTLRTVEIGKEAISGVFGDRLVALTDEGLTVWDLDLGEAQPLTAWTQNFCQAVGLTTGQRLYERIRSVDFSDDLRRMSFIDEEGVKLYSFTDDIVTPIPGTAPYNDAQDTLGGESYGTTWLVDGGRKVFAVRYGWEWTAGYLLYDIDTGTQTHYPYGGGYGIGRVVTDSAAYLAGHSGTDTDQVMIRFSTGEVLPSDLVLAEGMWSNGGARYDAFFEPVGGRNIPGDGLLTQRLVLRDNETQQIEPTDFILTAPAGGEHIMGVTSDGKAYVYAEYLGEINFWRIG